MNGRACNGCSLCCKLLPVPEIDKPATTKCKHQRLTGCTVYHNTRKGFPMSCAVWSCMWLLDSEFNGLRPDRAGYVIDMMPDIIRAYDKDADKTFEVTALQVWCDPTRPDAWRDPHLLKYAEERGLLILVRYNTQRAITVFPVSPNNSGPIAVDTGTMAPSVTGSLLLDRLEGHPIPTEGRDR